MKLTSTEIKELQDIRNDLDAMQQMIGGYKSSLDNILFKYNTPKAEAARIKAAKDAEQTLSIKLHRAKHREAVHIRGRIRYLRKNPEHDSLHEISMLEKKLIAMGKSIPK
jgi:hypothetical protein